jgi:hypothetical protein
VEAFEDEDEDEDEDEIDEQRGDAAYAGRHRPHRSPARGHATKVLYGDDEWALVVRAAQMLGLRPSSYVASVALSAAQLAVHPPAGRRDRPLRVGCRPSCGPRAVARAHAGTHRRQPVRGQRQPGCGRAEQGGAGARLVRASRCRRLSGSRARRQGDQLGGASAQPWTGLSAQCLLALLRQAVHNLVNVSR